jgi:hypothetical protein
MFCTDLPLEKRVLQWSTSGELIAIRQSIENKAQMRSNEPQ